MTEEERPFSVQVERSIAERAAGGDSSAVAELYDAYERQLYGYCHRICRNPEDAADATQDAFCSVIQRLPGLDTQSLNFAAYLFTTARNACMDIIKQRGRAEPTDEVPEDPFATAAIDTDPERQLLTGDQQRAAREASDRLPESQRTVLALREVSELSYDEIAETMGMKPNAVAQLISRARLNFYKQLRTGAVVISPLDDAAQRAIELTVQRQDGKINTDDLDWLQAHLKENEASRINAEAIQESAALYRAIAPAVVIAGMRSETLQRAIDSIGSGPTSESGAGDGGSGSGATGATAATSASAGAALGAKPDKASANNQPITEEAGDRRRDQRRAAGALAVLILIVLLGGSLESDQVAPAASATTVEAPSQETTAVKSGGEPRNGTPGDKPVASSAAAQPPTTSQNSQAPGDKPVKSGGNSNGSEKNGSSGGQKTTSGGQSGTPPAQDPAPPTSTPPAEEPSSTPDPTPPPPKKPPAGPIDFCSTNCNPPPPVP